MKKFMFPAIALVMLILAFASNTASAVSQSDIDALKDQKAALRAEQDEIKSTIENLSGEQTSVIAQKAALDEQNELARQEIELINEQIDIYDQLIEVKGLELEDAIENENTQMARYRTRMRAMEEDGSVTYLSVLFQASSFPTTDYLTGISTLDDSSLFILKETPTADSSAPGGNYLKHSLLRIGAAGETLLFVDLDELMGENLSATGILAVENRVFISTPEKVFALDRDGNLVHTFDLKGPSPLSLVRGANGEALICEVGDTEVTVRELSDDGTETANKYSISGRYMGVIDGFGGDGIYVYDDSRIYSVDYRSGRMREVVDLSINNISTYGLIRLGTDSFFSIEAGVPTIWEPRDESLGEIVTLNLAAYDIDPGLSGAIVDFNEASEQYKITVTDYAIYDTAESSTAGLTLLNTEILSGNLPDLFDLSKLPGQTYARRGMLADLSEWIENDPDISPHDFVSGVINCITDSEGHIYEMVPDFVPRTLVGSADVLPSGSGWTVGEFLDWTSSHADSKIFAAHITREDFLQYILAASGDFYVDYENAACNFTGSDFTGLLEFASTLQSKNELDSADIRDSQLTESGELFSGNQLLSIANIVSPVSRLMRIDTMFDSKPKFIGFPTNSGTGCAMVPYMRLGMSSVSEKQEGVWAFMKFLLSDAYQGKGDDLPALPVLQSCLEAYIDERIAAFLSVPASIKIDFADGTTTAVESFASDDLLDRAFAIIDSMDCVYEWDEAVYDIILDEASAYFSGQRSLEDTAAMIQSRAQIYVSEQYG